MRGEIAAIEIEERMMSAAVLVSPDRSLSRSEFFDNFSSQEMDFSDAIDTGADTLERPRRKFNDPYLEQVKAEFLTEPVIASPYEPGFIAKKLIRPLTVQGLGDVQAARMAVFSVNGAEHPMVERLTAALHQTDPFEARPVNFYGLEAKTIRSALKVAAHRYEKSRQDITYLDLENQQLDHFEARAAHILKTNVRERIVQKRSLTRLALARAAMMFIVR
jgi:hypothetical protein